MTLFWNAATAASVVAAKEQAQALASSSQQAVIVCVRVSVTGRIAFQIFLKSEFDARREAGDSFDVAPVAVLTPENQVVLEPELLGLTFSLPL